jgi:ribitol-5-phosphate 2-dehydrogenase
VRSDKVVLYMPERLRVESYEIEERGVIVKPTYLSVCNADIRYYLGERPAQVLKKKLPLVLIHEAVGEVVYSDDGDYAVGDNVVIVPISRAKSPLQTDYNYDYPGSTFMSSSVDGCMQTYLQLTRENLVKFSALEPQQAVTTELASVAMQALRRLKNFYDRPYRKVAIWGTGSVAFWMSLLMKVTNPDVEITVVGRSHKKLDSFSFADHTVLVEDLECSEQFDMVVEAVGGYGAEEVLEKAVKVVKPVGCILLLGVSEMNINVNTRGWMEKGLMILTSHRSVYEDFADALRVMKGSDVVRQNIGKAVSRIIDTRSFDDIHEALGTARVHQFKTVMKWNFEEGQASR